MAGAAGPAVATPAVVTRGDGTSVGAGFDYRRTAGAFGLVVPVSTKGLMLATEERTLSILRSMVRAVPFESRWYPVMSRLVDLHVGRVAGMGGDPTVVRPSADGDWAHPKDDRYWDDFDRGHTGHGGHDGGGDQGHHDHDHDDQDHDGTAHDHHDHGHRPGDCVERVVTGKIVSLQFDHFGDFVGFVVEDECDGHALVRSVEGHVRRLADQAWRSGRPCAAGSPTRPSSCTSPSRAGPAEPPGSDSEPGAAQGRHGPGRALELDVGDPLPPEQVEEELGGFAGQPHGLAAAADAGGSAGQRVHEDDARYARPAREDPSSAGCVVPQRVLQVRVKVAPPETVRPADVLVVTNSSLRFGTRRAQPRRKTPRGPARTAATRSG